MHRIGEVQGRPYLVSELLKGRGLDEVTRPVPWRRVLDIAVGLTRGLAAAHERGVLHRDIKPANVLLTEAGPAKLLDFGLAKLSDDLARSAQGEALPAPLGDSPRLTGSGSMIGTPLYMAPELWRGEPASPRSDLYSLGALLYELCCGAPPHTARSVSELREAVQERDARSLTERAPEAHSRLCAAIERCLAREAARRFASARELQGELESIVEELRPAAKEPAGQRRGAPRRRDVLIGAGLLGCAALGGVAYRGARRGAEMTGGGRRSVAVLGFKNLSSQPAVAWLSTALSELITGELAAGEALRLVPGESVARMKIELGLSDADGYARDTLERIRRNLGSDLIVVGSYLALAESEDSPLRLGIKVQDAGSGDIVAAVSDTELRRRFLDLVSRAGAALRCKLGMGALLAATAGGLAAARPAGEEATQAYAEGLQRLRHFDAMGATRLLERAVTADPKLAQAHAALSDAWTTLGYLDRARRAAQLAVDNAAALPRAERLLIEARYRRATGEPQKAVEIYRALLALFPDALEHGLELVRALVAADQPRAALETAEALLRGQGAAREDPRLEYEAAYAAYRFSDFRAAKLHAGRAADRARSRLSPLLVARSRALEAWVAFNIGELQVALERGEEARLLFAGAGDLAGEADALGCIGPVHMSLDRCGQGVHEQQEALRLYLEVGNRSQAGVQYSDVGNSLCQLGRIEEARSHAERGIALGEEMSRREAIGAALVVKGWSAP